MPPIETSTFHAVNRSDGFPHGETRNCPDSGTVLHRTPTAGKLAGVSDSLLLTRDRVIDLSLVVTAACR